MKRSERMTDTEFYSRLPEGTKKPNNSDFELIDFVYCYHPSIDPSKGKDQIARLYSEFGMRIIHDMFDTAKRTQEIDQERRKLRRQIKELDEEYDALKRGDPVER